MIRSPQFGSLNHRRPAKHNAPGLAAASVAFGQSGQQMAGETTDSVESDPKPNSGAYLCYLRQLRLTIFEIVGNTSSSH